MIKCINIFIENGIFNTITHHRLSKIRRALCVLSIICVDLTNSKTNNVLQLEQRGHLDSALEFGTPLASTINIFVVSFRRQELEEISAPNVVYITTTTHNTPHKNF